MRIVGWVDSDKKPERVNEPAPETKSEEKKPVKKTTKKE